MLGFLPSLFRVLEAPPDLPNRGVPFDGRRAPPVEPLPATLRSALHAMRQGIVFEQVSFTYPGRTDRVLRDVSFTLEPDECVALVGHNGAGKTTIVKTAPAACTTRRLGAFCWTAWTCENTIWMRCAGRWASSSRTSCAMN